MRRITGHESGFLKAHAGGKPYKVTMPAASYMVTRGYVPGVTDKAYADRKAVLADVAAIINQEIKDLIAEGKLTEVTDVQKIVSELQGN